MLKKLVTLVVRFVPAGVLRWVGRVQFKIPVLRRVLGRLTEGALGGESVIAKGPARGLKIDPTGAHPGYALGTSEPVLQQALVEHLAAGGVFYDLGANVGFFTVLASRLVGPGGSVVAFEPDAQNAAALSANVARNDLSNVEIVTSGVAERSGTLRFKADGTTASRFAGPDEEAIEVPVTSLDDFLASGHPAPTLLKLDIEGAEVAALQGAAKLIRDHRPTVLCEVHGTEAAVREILAGAGYGMRLLEEEEEGDTTGAWNPHLLAVPQLEQGS